MVRDAATLISTNAKVEVGNPVESVIMDSGIDGENREAFVWKKLGIEIYHQDDACYP